VTPSARVIVIVPATTGVTFVQMDAGNQAGHSQILVTSVPRKSPLVVSHQKASAGSGPCRTGRPRRSRGCS
jgi:hypothetical protein